MAYFIQTRKIDKGKILDVQEVMYGHSNPALWSNYPHNYTTKEEAIIECELMIKSGQYQAQAVRVVEVVCEFEAVITVNSKSQKYNNGGIVE